MAQTDPGIQSSSSGNKGGNKNGRRNVKHQTLHLMEYSSNHNLTNQQLSDDLNTHLSTLPDVMGVTEMRAGDNRLPTLRQVAADHKYLVVHQPNVDEVFFVNTSDNLKVVDRHRTLVVKGNGLPAGNPNEITTRYVSWVKVRWYGLDVFVHMTHWESKVQDTHQAAVDSMLQTKTMAAQVRKNAVGKTNIAFFMGDLNYKDGDPFRAPNNPNDYFRAHGLQTIYDEMNARPGGSQPVTIDIIGSAKPDDRVSGKRYKIYPKGNSDHRAISAWYDVEIRDQTKGAGDGPPPVFESAGNINWGDYKDSTIYPLPYAVDDTDTFNG